VLLASGVPSDRRGELIEGGCNSQMGHRATGRPPEPDADDDRVEAGDGLSVMSRPMGVASLRDGPWRQLGVDRAVATVLGGRRFTTEVERVLFALVANRAIDLASKLAEAEWASPMWRTRGWR
jgi:hypothetical protein